jgi:hypothetical protein
MKFHTPRKRVTERVPCAECGTKPFTPYMIQDDLWKKVAGNTSLLCLSCFTKKLGRKLKLDDFKPCQLTNLIMLGNSIGTGEEIDMTEGYKDEPAKVHFRMIGDVHGELLEYIKLAKGAEYSLQVGDLGFDCMGLEQYLSPQHHFVVGGNHDNYNTLNDGETFYDQPPHYLKDFGSLELPGVPKLFYVRGARSVDKDRRTAGHDWWPHEELNYRRMTDAITAYNEAKPDFVVSHECPAFLVNEVTRWKVPLRPSSTAFALESMFENHQPKVWIFGHFHNDWSMEFKGTYFRCLDIRTTYDLTFPFGIDEFVSGGKITSLNIGGK